MPGVQSPVHRLINKKSISVVPYAFSFSVGVMLLTAVIRSHWDQYFLRGWLSYQVK